MAIASRLLKHRWGGGSFHAGTSHEAGGGGKGGMRGGGRSSAKWEYFSAEKHAWEEFGPEDTELLEKAFAAGAHSCELPFRGSNEGWDDKAMGGWRRNSCQQGDVGYVINFLRLSQINMLSGSKRAIRRGEESSGNLLDLPSGSSVATSNSSSHHNFDTVMHRMINRIPSRHDDLSSMAWEADTDLSPAEQSEAKKKLADADDLVATLGPTEAVFVRYWLNLPLKSPEPITYVKARVPLNEAVKTARSVEAAWNEARMQERIIAVRQSKQLKPKRVGKSAGVRFASSNNTPEASMDLREKLQGVEMVGSPPLKGKKKKCKSKSRTSSGLGLGHGGAGERSVRSTLMERESSPSWMRAIRYSGATASTLSNDSGSSRTNTMVRRGASVGLNQILRVPHDSDEESLSSSGGDALGSPGARLGDARTKKSPPTSPVIRGQSGEHKLSGWDFVNEPLLREKQEHDSDMCREKAGLGASHVFHEFRDFLITSRGCFRDEEEWAAAGEHLSDLEDVELEEEAQAEAAAAAEAGGGGAEGALQSQNRTDSVRSKSKSDPVRARPSRLPEGGQLIGGGGLSGGKAVGGQGADGTPPNTPVPSGTHKRASISSSTRAAQQANEDEPMEFNNRGSSTHSRRGGSARRRSSFSHFTPPPIMGDLSAEELPYNARAAGLARALDLVRSGEGDGDDEEETSSSEEEDEEAPSSMWAAVYYNDPKRDSVMRSRTLSSYRVGTKPATSSFQDSCATTTRPSPLLLPPRTPWNKPHRTPSSPAPHRGSKVPFPKYDRTSFTGLSREKDKQNRVRAKTTASAVGEAELARAAAVVAAAAAVANDRVRRLARVAARTGDGRMRTMVFHGEGVNSLPVPDMWGMGSVIEGDEEQEEDHAPPQRASSLYLNNRGRTTSKAESIRSVSTSPSGRSGRPVSLRNAPVTQPDTSLHTSARSGRAGRRDSLSNRRPRATLARQRSGDGKGRGTRSTYVTPAYTPSRPAGGKGYSTLPNRMSRSRSVAMERGSRGAIASSSPSGRSVKAGSPMITGIDRISDTIHESLTEEEEEEEKEQPDMERTKNWFRSTFSTSKGVNPPPAHRNGKGVMSDRSWLHQKPSSKE